MNGFYFVSFLFREVAAFLAISPSRFIWHPPRDMMARITLLLLLASPVKSWDTCRLFKDIYPSGKELCEKMWGEAACQPLSSIPETHRRRSTRRLHMAGCAWWQATPSSISPTKIVRTLCGSSRR